MLETKRGDAWKRICTEHVLSAAPGCTGSTGKTATCTMVIVYLVNSFGTSATSSGYWLQWLQMRVYPCGGGDGMQCQMAV